MVLQRDYEVLAGYLSPQSYPHLLINAFQSINPRHTFVYERHHARRAVKGDAAGPTATPDALQIFLAGDPISMTFAVSVQNAEE